MVSDMGDTSGDSASPVRDADLRTGAIAASALEPPAGHELDLSGGETCGRPASPCTTRPAARNGLDERIVRLIHRYCTPDRCGWAMAPADLLHRLRAWHGVRLTPEQLTDVLRTVPGGGGAVMAQRRSVSRCTVIAPEVAARIVAWHAAGENPSGIGREFHMTLAEVSTVLREARSELVSR